MQKEEKDYSGKPFNSFANEADLLFDELFADGLQNVEGDANRGMEPEWTAALIIQREVESDINHAFNHLSRK